MSSTENVVLAVNAGSSSIKFALYRIAGQEEHLLFSGTLEAIGTPAAKLTFRHTQNEEETVPLRGYGIDELSDNLVNWLLEQDGFDRVNTIGHRVVHGMAHTRPEQITPALIAELKSLISYDPEHLPSEIRLIEIFSRRFPDIPQVACFDTAFHQTMPTVAQLMAIPRRYREKGIRRYGFHGLSYQYLTEELSGLNKDKHLPGKVILAHLGNGASMAALQNGQSIDTSMGFTPGAGIPMSTRSGDLDPGVAAYLLQQEKLSPRQFNYMVNHESGLLGVSGTSPDIRELLKIREVDGRAAEAVNLFCYQVKKYIGAYAAALGGLDMLVFSGGIGEHLPQIRTQVCQGLAFLGIELNPAENLKNALIISKAGCSVNIRVLPTNEALMMARLITRKL
jgi:acetate kinase